MTTGDPEKPAQEFGGVEYASLEDSRQPDLYAPVDYPADAGFPPPIYAPYPGGAPGYYPAYDPYRPVRTPGTNGKAIASLVTSIGGLALAAGLILMLVYVALIASGWSLV